MTDGTVVNVAKGGFLPVEFALLTKSKRSFSGHSKAPRVGVKKTVIDGDVTMSPAGSRAVGIDGWANLLPEEKVHALEMIMQQVTEGGLRRMGSMMRRP